MVQLSDKENAAIADLIPELDRLAADAMADWKVPGAALAVVQNGEVVLSKAYGQRDIEANLPATDMCRALNVVSKSSIWWNS